MENALFTIPEAARHLRVGRSLFYEIIAARHVAVVKLGRRALIPAAELQRLTEELVAEARAKVAA